MAGASDSPSVSAGRPPACRDRAGRYAGDMWSRRQVLGAGVLALAARPARAFAKDASMTSDLILRTIPSSGEPLPAIGLGSWQTFDVDDAGTVQPVLARFLALGGRAID